MMEPLLKWVGSKRWHVDMLRGYVINSRLVELFAGSAALSFGLEVEHAHLNDANPHLMNFYHHVLAGDMPDFSGPTSEQEFYACRYRFNTLISTGGASSAEAAGLFYYLNCTAFNNLWRVNGRGEFNCPFRKGRESVPILGTLPVDRWAWSFSNDDFRDVILEADDFVYADPPYLDTYNGYTAEPFTEFDFADLVALLAGHPGKVVIMNSAHQMAIDICRSAGLHVQLIESQQRMHNSRGRDDKIPELMASNFVLTPVI